MNYLLCLLAAAACADASGFEKSVKQLQRSRRAALRKAANIKRQAAARQYVGRKQLVSTAHPELVAACAEIKVSRPLRFGAN